MRERRGPGRPSTEERIAEKFEARAGISLQDYLLKWDGVVTRVAIANCVAGFAGESISLDTVSRMCKRAHAAAELKRQAEGVTVNAAGLASFD